jgi:hypothetical protein
VQPYCRQCAVVDSGRLQHEHVSSKLSLDLRWLENPFRAIRESSATWCVYADPDYALAETFPGQAVTVSLGSWQNASGLGGWTSARILPVHTSTALVLKASHSVTRSLQVHYLAIFDSHAYCKKRTHSARRNILVAGSEAVSIHLPTCYRRTPKDCG